MKLITLFIAFGVACRLLFAANDSWVSSADQGPAAALSFALRYRGDVCVPGVLNCYPEAKGIPFSDTAHIIPMHMLLWTPADIVADFQRRRAILPPTERKKGIIVVIKTERCATKELRACTVTTAALEKQSTPWVNEFAIYGLQLKPRDHDDPPGHLKIETGLDAWKNDAAGEYGFRQGPGATIVFIDPSNGSKIETTNAVDLHLMERDFISNQGRTPELEEVLKKILQELALREKRGVADNNVHATE